MNIANCPGPGSGSEPDPFCKIQDGIDAAIDGDTVLITDGIYTGFGNKNLSYDGKAITVQSENGPENCIIDCEGAGRGVRFIDQETVSSVLHGLTILDGNVATSGGGILCLDSSPTISDCWIVGNSSFEFGGGIACIGFSNPVINNSLIDLNSAEFGGGIGCDATCNPSFTDSAIRFNTSNRFGGGLAAFASGSSITFVTCTIYGNEAVETGGGLYVSEAMVVDSIIADNLSFDIGGGIFSSSDVTMIGSDISDNLALGNGGGMHIDSGTFTDCRIVGNSSDARGGGVYSESDTLLTRCTVSNNFATGIGGGVFYAGAESQDAILTNCIVNGNEASLGGGVGVEQRNFKITGCTFWGNVAASGGGAVSVAEGEALLSNSIFWADEAEVGPELYFEGDTAVTVEYCDVEGGGGSVHTDQDVKLFWVQNINADPLLLDPAGCDFHLTVNSPCIDAGRPNFIPEPGETDIDGEERVAGVAVDMGADEFHDSDGDGVPDITDICPAGDDNADSDLDGVPDACDPCPIDNPDDSDGDGICDSDDPCPSDNPDDSDGDGVCDSEDVCPGSDDAEDDDGDLVPDGCDNCPTDENPSQADSDEDGVGNDCDNCELFNPDQADCQPNGVGDVCDIADGTSNDNNKNGVPDECDPCVADLNGDGVVDASDLAILLGSWGPCGPCPADLFVDGIIDASDLAILLGNWGPCE